SRPPGCMMQSQARRFNCEREMPLDRERGACVLGDFAMSTPAQSVPPEPEHRPRAGQRLKRFLLGGPKDLQDPHLFRHISLISISIAAGGDAVFSVLPDGARWANLVVTGLPLKLHIELLGVLVLVLLNLRGVKESVTVLMPIFLAFLLTHAVIIGTGIGLHLGRAQEVVQEVSTGLSHGMSTLGLGGLLLLFVRAYSLGGGTYTGIEAVSNGLQIMREPRVQTAKRTMAYMAISLAVTASGIILCYLLLDIHYADPDHTMNSLLAAKVAGGVRLLGMPVGRWFVFLTLLSEALLLFVAAQAGFIDGPRVMANMAHDSWLPHRFSALSDRLTMQNGVL